jgi:amino acid adenylation domain-containing protein
MSQGRTQRAVPVGWLEAKAPSEPWFQVGFSWHDLAAMPASPVECETQPEDVAHILFTSGSTGIPKGVMITHSSVAHFLSWAVRYFGTNCSDRISCHPPLHFDLSTFDIYGTFLAGAELHLVPPEYSLLPHKLAEFIRRAELTQWFSVPSVLRYMAQFDVVRPHDFPSLKRLLWCGEAIPTPTLIHWMGRLPHVTFTNLYGPTEATIASSYYTLPACPEHDQAEIPVGTACDGEELLVLEDSLGALPAGETGDLYIRGVGLSPGYWGDPQKTAAAFLEGPQGRLYKTGDLARVGPDGLVYLLGRADTQIKSRGYRIELGEIEAALYTLGCLEECAVVAVRAGGFEGATICCAYRPARDVDVTPAEIRKRLGNYLPSYMMPSQWLALSGLPLNANGKIDRPRLREEFATAIDRGLGAELTPLPTAGG